MIPYGTADIEGYRNVYAPREIRKGRHRGKVEVLYFSPSCRKGTVMVDGKNYRKKILPLADIRVFVRGKH